ncbi:MAG: hydroxymethylglutaryl-CoA lyase [Nitriliruptoraceae bacterium]
MELPDQVTLIEIGPREAPLGELPPSTAVTIAFIERLTQAGLAVIEATSFPGPAAAPGAPEAVAVLEGLPEVPGVRYAVQVADASSLEQALAAGAREIGLEVSASGPHSERDLGGPVEEVLERAGAIVRHARNAGCRTRATVAMIAGCPYQGEVAPSAVLEVTTALFECGCDEVCLQDTIGVGTPLQIQDLLARLAPVVLVDRLAVHLRDTYGQGLANTLAALEAGVGTTVTSAGGIGGEPFPHRVAGNLATEDLLYALEGSGVATGVDLEEVVATTAWLSEQLWHTPRSRVAEAVLARRRGG